MSITQINKHDAYLINDNFQNFKRYGIQKAQMVIADIPYNLDKNAYASCPLWWEKGEVKNGESKVANKAFFDTDKNFNLNEFFHFCSKLIVKDKKEKEPGCILIFCSFIQQFYLIDIAKKYGFNHYINLVFRKNTSPQVLKANMKIVGNCEYGLLFYRERLPKFRNEGRMIFNCFDYLKDSKEIPRIHPTQKSIRLLQELIRIFTDEGDVVIDPCCGSGSTLRACIELNRKSYGFEIKKEYIRLAKEKLFKNMQKKLF